MAKLKLNTKEARDEVKELISIVKELKESGIDMSTKVSSALDYIENELKMINSTGTLSVAKFNAIENALRRAGIAGKVATKEMKTLVLAALKASAEIQKTASSYEKLEDSYKKAVLSARNLAAQYGAQSAKAQEAATKAKLLGAQLKEIQAITVESKTAIVTKTTAYDKLNIEYREAIALTKNLAVQFGVESDQAIKAAQNAQVLGNKLREVNNLTKATTTSSKAAVGAFQRLNNEYREAVLHAKNMAVQYGVFSKRARAAAKAARVLGDRLDRVNRQADKVSRTTKVLNAIISKLGFLMAAYVGVQMFVSLGKSIYETLKILDAFNFSMKAVIRDDAERAQTLAFLNEITDNYGANLVATTNRYIKFRAAAGQANLTMQETQDIFETMTKVSGVLGLQTDELSGIYLALEQMISKGKITTEELRRQLGERLPGAVDIMAKSMGVSTEKLGEMMKKGEVITKDVLPAFAREVEKAYSIENVDKIDTLTAAQNRLSNSWINLINTINGSEGTISTWIIDFFNSISSTLKMIEKATRSDTQWFDIKRAQGFEHALENINRQRREYLEISEETEMSEKDFHKLGVENLIRYGKEYNRLKESVDELQAARELLSKSEFTKEELADILQIKKTLNETGKANLNRFSTMEDVAKATELELTRQLKALGYAQGEIDAAKSLFKVKEDIKEIEKETGKINTDAEDLAIARARRQADLFKIAMQDKSNDLDMDLQLHGDYYKQLGKIAELEAAKAVKLADGNSIKIIGIKEKLSHKLGMLTEKQGSEEVAIYADNMKERLHIMEVTSQELLNNEIFGIKERGRQGLLTTEQVNKEIKEAERKANDALLLQQIEFLEDWITLLDLSGEKELMIRAKIAKLKADISVKANEEEEEAEKLSLETKLNLIRDFVNEVGALTDAIFNRRIEQINAEILAEEQKYDRLIVLAENDAQQKANLERQKAADIKKLEAKRLKEQQKQAKSDKAFALFDIGLGIAVGIAANLKTPWMVAAIAAIGAAQIATVLATPIPQYAKGLDNAKEDHVAMINDGGQKEYIERDGQILSTNTKNAIVNLRKGDRVHKNYEAMSKDSMLMSMMTNGNNISENEFDRLESVIESGLNKGFKKAKINNNITLRDFDFRREAYKESLSRWN